MPEREGRGEGSRRAEDSGGGQVEEHEAETLVDAELAELHLERHGSGLGVGVRLAHVGERLCDVRGIELGADQNHHAAGALQNLWRVGGSGVGGGGAVAEKGDGTARVFDEMVVRRRRDERRLDVSPVEVGRRKDKWEKKL